MVKIKIDRDFSKNRSDKYQYSIVESPSAPDLLAEFSDARGIAGIINNAKYDEELFELQDQLKLEFWRIIETELTERQREVLKLCADGLTQMEIARQLGVNQSSITKSIHGNCDYCKYRNGKKVKKVKKVYGGSRKKLRRVANQDLKIQEILFRINELQNESPY